MTTFYHHCWDEAARALDQVRSGDYEGAYRAAYGGSHCLDTRTSEAAREIVDGRSAALAVWVQVQRIPREEDRVDA